MVFSNNTVAKRYSATRQQKSWSSGFSYLSRPQFELVERSALVSIRGRETAIDSIHEHVSLRQYPYIRFPWNSNPVVAMPRSRAQKSDISPPDT